MECSAIIFMPQLDLVKHEQADKEHTEHCYNPATLNDVLAKELFGEEVL